MNGIVKKTAYVYLPYGYSKDKQYNILVPDAWNR